MTFFYIKTSYFLKGVIANYIGGPFVHLLVYGKTSIWINVVDRVACENYYKGVNRAYELILYVGFLKLIFYSNTVAFGNASSIYSGSSLTYKTRNYY